MAKLSKKQIERQIHERALNTANILLTDHARKRMRERRMERYVEGRDIGVVVAFEIDAAGLGAGVEVSLAHPLQGPFDVADFPVVSG